MVQPDFHASISFLANLTMELFLASTNSCNEQNKEYSVVLKKLWKYL